MIWKDGYLEGAYFNADGHVLVAYVRGRVTLVFEAKAHLYFVAALSFNHSNK